MIYLLSAYKLKKESDILYDYLIGCGFSVYYPIKDTDQKADWYAQNTKAIKDSMIVVAILDYCGKDFAYEAGYAHALNIPILGYSRTRLNDSSGMFKITLDCEGLEGLLNWITLRRLK